jgi:hypothetical protein
MKKIMFIVAGVALIATAVIAKTSNTKKEDTALKSEQDKTSVDHHDTVQQNFSAKSEFQKLDPIMAKSRKNDVPGNVGFHPRGTPGAATKRLDHRSNPHTT